VAYIRFASVYRHFEDLDEFVREIQKMGGPPSQAKGTDAAGGLG
jgi:transcriptional regulator NrdR family protein